VPLLNDVISNARSRVQAAWLRWTAPGRVGRWIPAHLLRSYTEQLRRRFEAQCISSLPRFQERVLPAAWSERGVLVSEGFALCTMCDAFDVELLIESGTYNGRSTKILAKYLDEGQQIKSIDVSIRPEAKRALAPYPHVELLEGDSRQLLPDLLVRGSGRSTAVFIDGPKGRAAVRLALRALDHPDVRFVAIHDLHRTRYDGTGPSRGRSLMDSIHLVRLYTDEGWFVERYGALDEGETAPDLDQMIQWQPYQYVHPQTGEVIRRLGSYGPTIGFLVYP
jgi:hypothetical protein